MPHTIAIIFSHYVTTALFFRPYCSSDPLFYCSPSLCGFWYTPSLHFAGKLLIIEHSKDGMEYFVCLFLSLYTIDLFSLSSRMLVHAYYMLDDPQYFQLIGKIKLQVYGCLFNKLYQKWQ